MGTWSLSIIGNDLSKDLIEEFRCIFSVLDEREALEKVERYFKEFGEDEISICWFTLAHFMLSYNRLNDYIKDKVLYYIEKEKKQPHYLELSDKMKQKRDGLGDGGVDHKRTIDNTVKKVIQ